MFVPRRKIWKLHKDSLKNNYRSSNRYRASSKKDASVEGYSNVRIEKRNRLKGAFLKATERSYGWTKDQARQKETWWWCYGVSEKWKLQKEQKQGNTSKKKHLEAKKEAKRVVYQAKCKSRKKKIEQRPTSLNRIRQGQRVNQ